MDRRVKLKHVGPVHVHRLGEPYIPPDNGYPYDPGPPQNNGTDPVFWVLYDLWSKSGKKVSYHEWQCTTDLEAELKRVGYPLEAPNQKGGAA